MKILIVEDNPTTADTFARVFRDMGHAVEVIGNRGQCLKTLPTAFRPDRILLDASLPEAFVRAVLGAFHVPVVGMTGGPGGELPAGVPVLQKPAEPAAVLAALERAGEPKGPT